MKRKEPEHELQKALVKELHRHCRVYWFSIPNGGKRHIRVASKLKAEGLRPGVADLCFILPGGRAAFLELKSAKGVLSDEQKAFRDAITVSQAWWNVARSLDEAWGILAAWGCLPSEARR